MPADSFAAEPVEDSPDMPKPPSKKQQALITAELIDPVIRVVRGQRIILDAELARIYGVTTKRLNEQVKRNRQRFPVDFMFQLTAKESNLIHQSTSQVASVNPSQFATGSENNLRSQIATSKSHGGRRSKPYAFTEHGVVMAANVLKSDHAVVMSVYVVRAFVKLRELLVNSVELGKKLDELERKLTARQDVHEQAILQLFSQVRDCFIRRRLSRNPKAGG